MHMASRLRSRRARALAWGLAAISAGSLLSGCSPSAKKPSTEVSPSPTPQALTKEEYVKQATDICVANASASAPPAPATAADFVVAVRREIDSLKDLQTKLRVLVPPTADKADLENKFLALRDRQIAALENEMNKVETAAAAGDLQGAKKAIEPAFGEGIRLAKEASPFLTAYGLQSCSL
jgi:hypothetical protein